MKTVHKNVLSLFGLTLLLLIALGTTGANAPHSYMSTVFREDAPEGTDIDGANYTIPDLGMEMIWIEPGNFAMGSPEGDPERDTDERFHEVKLRRGFWLSTHEVTVGIFEKFVAQTHHMTQSEMAQVLYNSVTKERFVGKSWRNMFDNPTHKPVVGVSKRDAYAFCGWLTRREQKAGRLPEGYEFSLPTEAQWEYASRAGSSTRYFFSDDADSLALYANYADRSAETENRDETHDDGYKEVAPVGCFEPNAWGLYDMYGNVFELCADTYWKAYQETEAVDPLGPAGVRMGEYVARGGSWASPPEHVRSAARHAIPSIDTYSDVGFRVALRRRYAAIVYKLTGKNKDWSLIRKGDTSRISHKRLGSKGITNVIHFPEKSLGFLQARIPEEQTGWVYIPTMAQGKLEVLDGVEIKLNLTKIDVKSDEGLAPLNALKPTDLQGIEITEKKVSNGALERITRLTGLREVNLHSRRIRDSGLKHLSDLAKLEKLDLGETKVRGPGLDYLQKCDQLNSLSLSSTKLTNMALRYVAGLRHLQVLKLDNTDLGDPRYKHYRRKYSDDFMAALDKRDKQDQISQFYAEVEELENVPAQVEETDGYLKSLSQLKELRELDLSRTLVSDSGLKHLSGLTELEVLRLEDTPLTGAGLSYVSNLTNLKEIDLRKTAVDDTGLAYLSELTGLEKLSAGDMWVVPLEADYETSLIQWFEGITPITDQGLAHLSMMKNLQNLSLGKTQITGEGLSHLTHLESLNSLSLKECRLNDESLTYIAGLAGLEVLDISGNRVTDEGLYHLLSLPHLKRVVAAGTLVTQEGAEDFMRQREDVEVILEEAISLES